MTVINLKKRRTHAPRDLVAIDPTSGPARFYAKMQRDIAGDLGGKRQLTRIEAEWIKAFCSCAVRLEYLNFQILLGDASECDVSSYAQLASTMLRIGTKLTALGLKRAVAADDADDFYEKLEKEVLAREAREREEAATD